MTATRTTRSASSRTRRPAPSGSTPTRTTTSSTTQAMKDYVVNHDVNHFGKDKVGTKDVVEVVPFVVQTDRFGELRQHRHRLRRSRNARGRHGRRQGLLRRPVRRCRTERAARGRPRLPVHHGLLHLAIRSARSIYLISVDHVNIIQMSIGGLPALNDDANDAEAQIVDNMTAASGVQFFFSQGNDGPGANTAGSPGTANAAIGSGAYQSPRHVERELRERPAEGRHAVDVLVSRSARGRRPEAEHRLAGLRAFDVAGVEHVREPVRRRCGRTPVPAPAGLRDDPGDVDGLADVGRRRRAPHLGGAPERLHPDSGAAAEGALLGRPLPQRVPGVRAGQRAHAGRPRVGRPEDEARDAGDHEQRPGQHEDLAVAGSV